MQCLKCNKEHDGSYGSGKFCSKSCACSRIKTEEAKKKISETNKLAWKTTRKETDFKSVNSNPDKVAKVKQIWINKQLEKDWNSLSLFSKKKRVILEQAKSRGLNVITIGERRNLNNRMTEILVTNYAKPKTLFD